MSSEAQREHDNAHTLADILGAYGEGLIRLDSASISARTYSQMDAEQLKLRRDQFRDAGTEPDQAFLAHVDRWSAFGYVGRISELTYATSLFDTYLNEITTFLLMMFPNALGKEVRFATQDVVSAQNPKELVLHAISKKAREVSYGSFEQRLQFLEECFGLKFGLSSEEAEDLGHYSSIRNVVVHDQGYLDLVYSPSGGVKAVERTCSLHPSGLAVDDAAKARNTYTRIVAKVTQALLNDVVKDHSTKDWIDGLLELLVKDVP